MLRFTLLLVFVFSMVGCETVPHTGRKQLNFVNNSELVATAQAQFEVLKKETPISKNREYNAMLQRVGERIAEVAEPDLGSEPVSWEFVVFKDDDMINAFAMPGGKVAVYTGLFGLVESDDDLAVIVGHEVAHVSAKHSHERVSQQRIAAGGALLLGIGTRDMDAEQQAMILAAYGAGASLGIILPYSRLHECEADEIGIMYSAMAGYNPQAAIPFWERMSASSQGAPPEFLSTHPSGATRIERLNAKMPEAMRAYEAAIARGVGR